MSGFMSSVADQPVLEKPLEDLEKPLEYDGSEPLPSPRLEKMAHLKAAGGITLAECYRKTATGKVPANRTCQVKASEIFSRPEVKARIAHLTTENAKTGQFPDPRPTAAPGDQVRGFDMDAEVVDETYVLRYLSAALRQAAALGAVDASTLKAAGDLVKRLEDRRQEQELATMDINHLAKHLTQWAGWPGDRIVQEIGGLRFLLDRMMDLMKVTPAEVINSLSTTAPST